MQVILLNGMTTKINLWKYRRRSAASCKSQFQFRVGQILSEEFPHDTICEEVVVPRERFVLDFLVPSLSMVIECQGRQHDQYVPFFHGTRVGFNDAKQRDSRKMEWCELNNLKLVTVAYEDDDQTIRRKVCG